jgi:predicted PurR-regulated permease PerM
VFDYVNLRAACGTFFQTNVITNPQPRNGRSATLLSIVLVVAVLYFARDIFIPLALAVLVSFLLAPMVIKLRHWRWGRMPSVLAVVTLAFVLVAAIGLLMSVQLSDLGHKLPEYQHNIHQKLQSIRDSSSGIVGQFSRMMHNFTSEFNSSHAQNPPAPGETSVKPVPVEIQQGDLSPLRMVPKILGSLLGIGLTGVIVVVFVIFMLLEQEDLRDRVIRLAGSRQLNMTTRALDEASERVSRYLLAQLLVNVAYGVAAGVALYFLGAPNPLLWGMLAALLRYIPYLGIWVAATMPAAVLFAIDPGWVKPVAVFGIFGGIDLLMCNFVEPLVYGNTTGLTPLAILVAAVFWTWLWGAVGLLLAIPLTVCVAVLGRYVPSLGFLGVLLSDEPVLTPDNRFYQRLLAMDVEEAAEVAEEFLKGKTLEQLYDDVIVPALRLAEEDCQAGKLEDEQRESVFQNMRMLVEDLAPRAQEIAGREIDTRNRGDEITPPESVPLREARVLCLPARSEADEIAALMLAQLLASHGVAVKPVSVSALASERLEEVSRHKAEVVCVVTVPPDGYLHMRYLCKRLSEHFHEPKIVAAILARGGPEELRRRETGIPANEVAATLSEASNQIRALTALAPPAGKQTAFSS